MMMNYFTPLDPSSSYLSINWTSMMLFSLFPMIFSMKLTRHLTLLSLITQFLKKEIIPILSTINKPNILLPFLSLFLLIFFSNFMSLFPYIFTPTSHLMINLPLSFTLWLTLIIYAWINNTNSMLTHLTPQTTPSPLIPFMILIEIISQIIRPLTLSIRLTTNMISGHLLLILLSSMMSFLNTPLLFTSFIPLMILITLETAVALIQAYVFSILLVLYTKEIN